MPIYGPGQSQALQAPVPTPSPSTVTSRTQESAPEPELAAQARYLDSLMAGLTDAQARHHNAYPPIHQWRRQSADFTRLEAAARTWGRLRGAHKLADRVLESSSLHTVLGTLELAEDRQLPPEVRLAGYKLLGKWQGLEPSRDGARTVVNVAQQISMAPPPQCTCPDPACPIERHRPTVSIPQHLT